LIVRDILKTEQSRVRDRFISAFTVTLSYSQQCRSEARLNNVDKQIKGLLGFEPASRTIHFITRQRRYDHDYRAPAFSQVNLFPTVVMLCVFFQTPRNLS
jgi:hypothetical protein